MRFKNWLLQEMESAEDITKKYSSIILGSPDYPSTVRNLNQAGVVADFDVNRHGSLGHRWAELFYKIITADTGGGNDEALDKQLAGLNSQISSMGFKSLDSSDPFYFFATPGKHDPGNKVKIHVKIPHENLDLLIKLVEIIKQNSSNIRQFKFCSFGGSFKSRRDNFVIYLSKQGEQIIEQITSSIKGIGLKTDIGNDYQGSNGSSLSQTQLVSLRLAAMIVSRPKAPQPKFANSSLWQTTEKQFVESDPVASRYLGKATATTPPAPNVPTPAPVRGGSMPQTATPSPVRGGSTPQPATPATNGYAVNRGDRQKELNNRGFDTRGLSARQIHDLYDDMLRRG